MWRPRWPWWLLCCCLAAPLSAAPHLSESERAYLNAHSPLSLCVDPDWWPFEVIDANGQHDGIAADLLALVQAELWAGKGGRSYVVQLQMQLQAQQQANDAARLRNQRLSAEVSDLKEGLEMVEEKARAELGMVKPGEIYVQVVRPAQR